MGKDLKRAITGGYHRYYAHRTYEANVQPHDTETTARNSWWLPLITWGEGYHNWHHIYVSDYRNGPRWYHFDPGKWWIASFSLVRMTRKLSRVKTKKKPMDSSSGMDQLA